MSRWENAVTDSSELRGLVGEPRPAQLTEILAKLDKHCRAWIERSPFIVMCSVGRDGMPDASPKGDPPGFVKILDDHTLAIL